MKDNNIYSQIIDVMKFRQAHVAPLKTRVIADDVGVSIHQTRYYLEELRKLNIVERSVEGRGKATYWLLY
ncbi:hypothetical protein KAM28_004490 [Salmonella enterica subsp. diarizonae serovar 47:k:z53:[z84]]|nr:hypothetical protein [Salmonella enterica subsp. diarizonae serovar 47:k:z53:[z84]]